MPPAQGLRPATGSGSLLGIGGSSAANVPAYGDSVTDDFASPVVSTTGYAPYNLTTYTRVENEVRQDNVSPRSNASSTSIHTGTAAEVSTSQVGTTASTDTTMETEHYDPYQTAPTYHSGTLASISLSPYQGSPSWMTYSTSSHTTPYHQQYPYYSSVSSGGNHRMTVDQCAQYLPTVETSNGQISRSRGQQRRHQSTGGVKNSTTNDLGKSSKAVMP